MSFEYLVEKENKIKKLDKKDTQDLAASISKDFDTWNDARRENLDQANRLSDEIFFHSGEVIRPKSGIGTFDDTEDKDSWKTKVKMCKTYMFYQVLKAFIWKNTYANMNSMFDVSGENQEADNDSNKQKAGLVDCFEKMEYGKTCDKYIDKAMIYGEMITMCSWKKKTQEYRRRITRDDLTNPRALKEIVKGKFHFIDEEVVYDNPYVYAVNPANFVWEVAQEDDWDNCPKIYRNFKTPDDIINNKYYTVSKEDAESIKALVSTSADDNSQTDEALKDTITNGGTIEVLEHWGNLIMEDGTVLKNWHVVVVGRKYVVRFEKNNRIENPFNKGMFIRDPKTGRGISPLLCVLNLAELQEQLMNRTCDLQTLQQNPPLLAPKGFFKEDEVAYYPGKIIEFGDELNPSQIKQMEFSVSIFLNDITFLSDLMAEVSGIFPNMAGADESRAKTATEISTKTQGQLTRLSMLIDVINNYMIVPDVKKVAKLRADFKSGIENIFINQANKQETIKIDDRIRQAEYRYTYSDRTATTERSNKADLIVNAIKEFAQFLPLNAPEIFTWYMEQKDVENPERFLQQQNTIPLELQQVLLQSPEIQQMVEMYNQQKENPQQQGGEQQKNVLPDASIPEAQPME